MATRVILENIETGETIEAPSSGSLPKGYRIKGAIVEAGKQDNSIAKAKLAVWAQKHGMPVDKLLEAGAWLLNKDCPYCQLGRKILRELEKHGEEKSKELIARILTAKSNDDRAALEEIRKSLWSSEQQI